MTTRGFTYLNHGTSHLARLAVSLYSLRQHHDEPVTLYDTGDEAAAPIIDLLVASRAVTRSVQIPIPSVLKPQSVGYAAKPMAAALSSYDLNIMLDADTIVAQSLNDLFGAVGDKAPFNCVTTAFSNWTTHTKLIRERLHQWHGVRLEGFDVRRYVSLALSVPMVAINTGVLAWRLGAPAIAQWVRLTDAGRNQKLADELAMQILVAAGYTTTIDERFNYSPLYGVSPVAAAVRHYHGSRHVADLHWRNLHDPAVADGFAGLNDWSPAGDARLCAFTKDRRP
jgi:hypothetical protein